MFLFSLRYLCYIFQFPCGWQGRRSPPEIHPAAVIFLLNKTIIYDKICKIILLSDSVLGAIPKEDKRMMSRWCARVMVLGLVVGLLVGCAQSVDRCNLGRFPSDATVIDLSNCGLGVLDGNIDHFSKLAELDLSGNQLTNLATLTYRFPQIEDTLFARISDFEAFEKQEIRQKLFSEPPALDCLLIGDVMDVLRADNPTGWHRGCADVEMVIHKLKAQGYQKKISGNTARKLRMRLRPPDKGIVGGCLNFFKNLFPRLMNWETHDYEPMSETGAQIIMERLETDDPWAVPNHLVDKVQAKLTGQPYEDLTFTETELWLIADKLSAGLCFGIAPYGGSCCSSNDIMSDIKSQRPPAQWAPVSRLHSLERLDLSENQLLTLPPAIRYWDNLVLLDLSSNALNAISCGIGELRNLKWLDLAHNGLTYLPPEMGQLYGLEKLDLSGNGLRVFPEALGNLRNLRSLNLAGNGLEALPASIGQLQNLTDLDLSQNSLVSLPAEMGQLTNLRNLNLQGNGVLEIPPSFGQLQNLEVLHLEVNGVDGVPKEVTNLKNLKILYLDWNGTVSSATQHDLKKRLPHTQIFFN
ncbi:MAG: leucine-rich repeat domain-containing protein [Gemmatimonadetes bacterium]|nr:MAG: leucine-rich repeat domain-containing protein [Gemmatimonadota bacterium]